MTPAMGAGALSGWRVAALSWLEDEKSASAGVFSHVVCRAEGFLIPMKPRGGGGVMKTPVVSANLNHKRSMSRENVERLLMAGGKDKVLRAKYNAYETKDEFISAAVADGYEFTVEELEKVLEEEGDSFESSGNPRTRQIWWR